MISLCNWTFRLLSSRLLKLTEAESQALVAQSQANDPGGHLRVAGPELKKPAGQKAKRLLENEQVQLHREINT